VESFKSYKDAKNEILRQCEVVEQAWVIATQSSEFEKLSGVEANNLNSEVQDLVNQARMRLASDTIEIGIFGEVKRGKSTLINALVGKRVSSMRVTPETAIPVWVEKGESKTIVIYADGTSEEVSDPQYAQEVASQRAVKRSGKEPVRVLQYTEVPWLPDGLRIVDTPGLQDPSLAESYESRTMAELERVSAAVFMFVSPPGAAGHEVQLLRRLALHGIDKVFLVCNFYPQVWNNKEEREEVLSYIRDVVVSTALASSTNSPKEIKIYGVNAKDALAAIEAENTEEYVESGVATLRDDIEEFLLNGALNSMTGGAHERLHFASNMVRRTLEQRERILRDPSRLSNAVRELEFAIESSANELSQIEISLHREGEKIGQQIGELLASPYEKSLEMVAACSSVTDLNRVLEGLGNLTSEIGRAHV